MKHRNSNSNAAEKSAARISAIAILSVIFALTLTACSTATRPAETKPAETNKPSVNSSPANAASANAGSTSSTNPSSTSGDLAGTYAVSGAGADGKTYQGEVLVTKQGAVYQMSWKLGAESYDGVAVQSGNTLAAAYTTGSDGKGCGAVIYKINADNSLEGKWGEWGVNSTGSEKAVLRQFTQLRNLGNVNSTGSEKAVPAGSVSNGVGTLDVSGTNADGSAYKGKLTVTKGANDVYQFAWDTGTKFIGTGVRMGEYLAAGSGAKQCGFVIYEVKGSTLEGKWGVPGSTTLGTEKATKK